MLLLERNNARALYIATTDNDLATVASKFKTKMQRKTTETLQPHPHH